MQCAISIQNKARQGLTASPKVAGLFHKLRGEKTRRSSMESQSDVPLLPKLPRPPEKSSRGGGKIQLRTPGDGGVGRVQEAGQDPSKFARRVLGSEAVHLFRAGASVLVLFGMCHLIVSSFN